MSHIFHFSITIIIGEQCNEQLIKWRHVDLRKSILKELFQFL